MDLPLWNFFDDGARFLAKLFKSFRIIEWNECLFVKKCQNLNPQELKNLGSLLMKVSQSNFDSYMVHSYLIATLHFLTCKWLPRKPKNSLIVPSTWHAQFSLRQKKYQISIKRHLFEYSAVSNFAMVRGAATNHGMITVHCIGTADTVYFLFWMWTWKI